MRQILLSDILNIDAYTALPRIKTTKNYELQQTPIKKENDRKILGSNLL